MISLVYLYSDFFVTLLVFYCICAFNTRVETSTDTRWVTSMCLSPVWEMHVHYQYCETYRPCMKSLVIYLSLQWGKCTCEIKKLASTKSCYISAIKMLDTSIQEWICHGSNYETDFLNVVIFVIDAKSCWKRKTTFWVMWTHTCIIFLVMLEAVWKSVPSSDCCSASAALNFT